MRGRGAARVGDVVEDVLRSAGSPLAVPVARAPEVGGLRDKLNTVRREAFESAFKAMALIEAQCEGHLRQCGSKDGHADTFRMVAKLAREMRRLMEVS